MQKLTTKNKFPNLESKFALILWKRSADNSIDEQVTARDRIKCLDSHAFLSLISFSICEILNAPPPSLRCGKAKAKLIRRDDSICTFLNPSLLVCLDQTLSFLPMSLRPATMPTILTTTKARTRLVALSIRSSEVSTSSLVALVVHERTRVELCRPTNLPSPRQPLRVLLRPRLNIVQCHRRQRQRPPLHPPPLRQMQTLVLLRY